MGVLYRPAGHADAAAAHCIYLAADEVFDYMFGPRAAEFIARDFSAGNGFFSHPRVLDCCA